jgi:hypothetical protein
MFPFWICVFYHLRYRLTLFFLVLFFFFYLVIGIPEIGSETVYGTIFDQENRSCSATRPTAATNSGPTTA